MTTAPATNDFSLMLTVQEAGKLHPAAVAELQEACNAKRWGRVAALAKMLVELERQDIGNIEIIGELLANSVWRVIGRQLAVDVLTSA